MVMQRRRKVSAGQQPAEVVQSPPEEPVRAQVPSANERHPAPWGQVIRDVFDLDVHATYTRLVDELTLGDNASEYGTVLRALDNSSRNLFEAARMARKAKIADLHFGTELDQELEVLRTAASKALQEEKAAGQRSKAATIQDINDRMLASWPDQVTSIRTRKEEMHGALRSIEALEVAWRERCQALRVLAQGFRNTGA